MTDPARRARPVGPPPPGAPAPPGGAPPRPPGTDAGPQTPPPGGGYVRYYSWSGSGPGVPWFAILLLVLGIGLLFQELTGLGFIPVVVLGLGIALLVAWLWRGVVGATVPGLVLSAWGAANVLADLDVLTGDGWSTLFVGVAFLLGWVLGRYQAARRTWALWLGTILGLVGLSEVADLLPVEVDGAAVMAIVLIGVGLLLIARSRLPQAR